MSGATSTKLNRLWRLQQQVYGCRREGWGIGIVRELGMDMYTLLYLKWINKDLAQETLLNVMWQPGWEGSLEFSSVLNHVQLCDPMDCSTPGFPVHHQFLELAQTHVHWVSDAIQPSHPLSLPSPLPSILPSIKIFSIESVLHIRWPKDWSFSFSISPSNEYSGLISFRMDWLDLLAVQGTLKSLLQHHSSKASILWCSAFFIVQLSHPYMTTGKTIALTIWPFAGKIMSLILICCLGWS